MNNYTPEPPRKRCFRCGGLKLLSEFNKDKYKADGFTAACKECRKHRLVKLAMPDGHKQCPKCRRIYPATKIYFYADNRSSIGLTAYCKACHDTLVKQNKITPEYKASQRQYAQRRRDNNPGLREQERQRQLARSRQIRHTPEEIAKRETPQYRLKRNIQRHNRRSKKRGLPFRFTDMNWRRCLDYFNNRCAACGRPIGLWHIIAADHWIAITDKRADNPGTVAQNIIPLCHTRKDGEGSCNQSKGNRDPLEWLVQQFGKRKAGEILKRIEAYFEWVKTHD